MILILLGCKSKKNSMPDEITNNQSGDQAVKISAEIGDLETESALIEITDARIIGNTLYLAVAYSGGCKDHEFKLFGASMIAKSLPPIRSMKLIHNNNDDNCRAYLLQKIEVDLRELAYQKEKGSVIYLNLDGWKERLTYTYE